MQRDWVEQIYIEAFEEILKKSPKGSLTKKQIKDAVAETFPALTDATRQQVKKQSKVVLKEHNNVMREFKRNLIKRWGKALDLLEVFIAYNLDYGVTLAHSFRSNNDKNVKFEVLLRLHARSCQIASEILELLKSGFADGAHARWRTLYEVSIFANFLNDKPDSLSQKYLDYSIVESFHERMEFQKNCKRLGYKPFPKKEMDNAEKQITSLKEKYGNDFVKPYGWAVEYLPNTKRNFAGMEETTSLRHMRSFYKSANNYVHGGSKGFLHKWGLYKQNSVMLAGPSNYGLADPGQNTAYSLFHSTLGLTGFETYLEDAIFVKVAESLIKELSDEFIKVQKQIESEEKAL
jgi:hypothetical protein